jgi:hypothetical protein
MSDWGDFGDYGDFDTGLSLRRELRLIRLTMSRLAGDMKKLSARQDSLEAQVAQLAQIGTQFAQTGLTMYFLGRVAATGPVGMAAAGGIAALTGVGRGLEVARETMLVGETVRTREVAFGTQADMQRYALDQSLRIWLKMIIG